MYHIQVSVIHFDQNNRIEHYPDFFIESTIDGGMGAERRAENIVDMSNEIRSNPMKKLVITVS